jgi:RecA/RadA recombinase
MIHREVDPQLRAALRAKLQKEYKREVIHAVRSSDMIKRLDSGSLALNYCMGGRGFPFHTITRLYGRFSSGKSTAIYRAIYVAQNYGTFEHARLVHLSDVARVEGEVRLAKKLRDDAKRVQSERLKCLVVATEGELDTKLIERDYGISTKQDDLEIVYSRRIEEIGQTVQLALGAYHFVAVDSTTGSFSIDELATNQGAAKSVEDEANNTGQNRARKWGYNLDWWQDRIGPDNVLIITSQIQAGGGGGYNKQVVEEAPGGEKLKHEPGVVLHFMPGQRLKRRPDGGLEPFDKEGGEAGAFGKKQSSGREVIIRCDKNKFGRAERVTLHHFDRTTAQWDPWHEYEKMAKYLRVVEPTKQGSTWYQLPNGSKTQSLRQAIINDPVFRRQIEERVYRCASDPGYEDLVLKGSLEPMLQLVESA